VNEKRVFSNAEVIEKLEQLNVELVVVDDTLREERIARDLKRADRSILPVNLIYPPNYPEEPAILLEELISPDDALKVLARMEEIQGNLKTNRLTLAQ
jgi:thiol:disulfide interchange protein